MTEKTPAEMLERFMKHEMAKEAYRIAKGRVSLESQEKEVLQESWIRLATNTYQLTMPYLHDLAPERKRQIFNRLLDYKLQKMDHSKDRDILVGLKKLDIKMNRYIASNNALELSRNLYKDLGVNEDTAIAFTPADKKLLAFFESRRTRHQTTRKMRNERTQRIFHLGRVKTLAG